MKLIKNNKKWCNKSKSFVFEEQAFVKLSENDNFNNYYEDTELNDLFEEGFTESEKVDESVADEYKYVLYSNTVYKIPIFKDYFNYKGLRCITDSDWRNRIVLSNYENETLIVLNEEAQLTLYYMLKEKFKL